MGGNRRWGRWMWRRPTCGTDPDIDSILTNNVSKTRTSSMYPKRASCTQVAGTLASDVF